MTDITNIRPAEQTLAAADAQQPGSSSTVERQGAVNGGKALPSEVEQEAQKQQAMEDAVSNIADFVQNVSRSLQFSVDDESGRTVMTVTDRETMEVVRQVPSEEVLVMSRIVKRMSSESPKGVLLQSEA